MEILREVCRKKDDGFKTTDQKAGDAIGAASKKAEVRNPHLILTSSSPHPHLIFTSFPPRPHLILTYAYPHDPHLTLT